MSPLALNIVLFRTEEEERSDGNNIGVYYIQNYGNLHYCGFMGIYKILKRISSNNNLGDSLCQNLRDGHWMLDYIVNRLSLHSETVQVLNLVFEIYL